MRTMGLRGSFHASPSRSPGAELVHRLDAAMARRQRPTFEHRNIRDWRAFPSAAYGRCPSPVPHKLQQEALLRMTRHDRRARVTAFERRLARVEPQPALLFFRAMALHARTIEQGPDARQKFITGRRLRTARRQRGDGKQCEDSEKCWHEGNDARNCHAFSREATIFRFRDPCHSSLPVPTARAAISFRDSVADSARLRWER
jgi:hypothetical protein